ncbi:anion permease [Burkholderia gladioli]|uniref:anion permease n=1 Tax=Burkholderia gladioli TaxID=28095 RepID=UPI002EDA894F
MPTNKPGRVASNRPDMRSINSAPCFRIDGAVLRVSCRRRDKTVSMSAQSEPGRPPADMPLTRMPFRSGVLPINAPQNMVCLGTDTFTAHQFAKVGIVVTVIGYLLLLGFGATYWRWLGWL